MSIIFSGKYPQQMTECPTRYHTRMCDTFVQIPILKMELDTLFSKVLCGMEQGDEAELDVGTR